MSGSMLSCGLFFEGKVVSPICSLLCKGRVSKTIHGLLAAWEELNFPAFNLGEPTSSAQPGAGESTAATGLENAHYHAQPSSSGAEAERWGFENANYVPLSDDFFSSAPSWLGRDPAFDSAHSFVHVTRNPLYVSEGDLDTPTFPGFPKMRSFGDVRNTPGESRSVCVCMDVYLYIDIYRYMCV
jgi:hypothetical protein